MATRSCSAIIEESSIRRSREVEYDSALLVVPTTTNTTIPLGTETQYRGADQIPTRLSRLSWWTVRWEDGTSSVSNPQGHESWH